MNGREEKKTSAEGGGGERSTAVNRQRRGDAGQQEVTVVGCETDADSVPSRRRRIEVDGGAGGRCHAFEQRSKYQATQIAKIEMDA